MDRPLRIVAVAASNRRRSLNRTLLDRAVRALEQAGGEGVAVEVIDLRRLPLPIYDADVQDRDGVPAAAHEIHDRVAEADAVVIATPEYNGGYPALLKNVIDWVSRIDMLVFHPRYVGLLAATPGKGGGRRGLDHLRALFDNIFVTSHPAPFSVPHANDAFTDDGWTDVDDHARMRGWAEEFVAAAVTHVETRDAA